MGRLWHVVGIIEFKLTMGRPPTCNCHCAEESSSSSNPSSSSSPSASVSSSSASVSTYGAACFDDCDVLPLRFEFTFPGGLSGPAYCNTAFAKTWTPEYAADCFWIQYAQEFAANCNHGFPSIGLGVLSSSGPMYLVFYSKDTRCSGSLPYLDSSSNWTARYEGPSPFDCLGENIFTLETVRPLGIFGDHACQNWPTTLTLRPG